MNRDLWAALAASLLVLVAVVLGFVALGGPGTQRLIHSDFLTVQAIAQLAQQINSKWRSDKALPANLDQFPLSAKQNRLTHELFAYHQKSGSEYELCATFAMDSRESQPQNPKDGWPHPKGHYCFELDASLQPPSTPYYY